MTAPSTTDLSAALQETLVELIDLSLQAKHYHWNVTGQECWPTGDLRHQVGQGDVQEGARRERHQHGHVHMCRGCVGDDPSHEERGCRQHVVRQRCPPRPSAMHQDPEVTKLLRHLMGGSDEPGHHTEPQVHDEG